MTATWKKESELKDFKSELDSLSRKINLTLASKEEPKEEVVKVEVKAAKGNSVLHGHGGVRM